MSACPVDLSAIKSPDEARAAMERLLESEKGAGERT
jgi:hypothetical protein